jgi:hypothetical protein
MDLNNSAILTALRDLNSCYVPEKKRKFEMTVGLKPAKLNLFYDGTKVAETISVKLSVNW